MSNEQLNTLVIKAAKRADKAPLEVLGPTFVPLRPLMVHLESNEHHVLFGRRGTGKTHVMRYLQNQLRRDAELVAYLDLRQVDSAAGVISSSGAGPADQATNVLIDIVESVHNQVLDQVLEGVSSTNLTQISEALDSIARVATQLRLVGDTEIEAEVEAACERDVSHRMDVSISSEPRLAMGKERRLTNAQSARSKRIDRGLETSHILLGPLSRAIRDLTSALEPQGLWLLLDEWASLQGSLQPPLADLLRRTFMATPGVTVNISAVHGRSRFGEVLPSGELLGLELGADTSASLDLDDFLLFRNDSSATLEFYQNVLYRHVMTMAEQAGHSNIVHRYKDRQGGIQALLGVLFSSPASFHRLVLGAEGVPRDLLQIAGLAASSAFGGPMTPKNVATATRDFSLRDKEKGLSDATRPVFANLLDQCSRQKSRIIPLRRNGESNDRLIQQLYDGRLIHRVREGISLDPQRPTEKYDVFVVDYGCFLGLLNEGRIRPVEDGLDPGARFADAHEIEIRARSFAAMTPGWFRRAHSPRR